MKHMLDLGPFDCRWPLKGRGADTLFCAEPTLKSPYCPKHLLRAYKLALPSKKQIKAAREAQRAQVNAMGAV